MSAKAINAPKSSPPVMKIVPVVVVLALVAGAAYYFLAGGGSSTAPTVVKPATTAAPTAAAPAAPGTAPAAAPVPEMTKEQLLKEASTAMREGRLVAPAGNNELELYLKVLEKEPNNASARDALREGFPMFTGPVEQAINAGNLDEANRVIELLTKVDASNFTLNILRSKLDAKKKQVEREQTVAAAAAARAAATPAQSAQSTQSTTTPAPASAEKGPAAAAPTTVASTTPAPAPAAPVAAPAPPPVAAAPAGGESHPAELVRAVQPDYPPDAYRSRAQGWVEVEFTVGADGSVSNASVVNSEPSRIFNNAALNAIKRWTFKPKMDNGKAVDDRLRRRIEFKLS